MKTRKKAVLSVIPIALARFYACCLEF